MSVSAPFLCFRTNEKGEWDMRRIDFAVPAEYDGAMVKTFLRKPMGFGRNFGKGQAFPRGNPCEWRGSLCGSCA